MAGTVLGSEDTTLNKIGKTFCPGKVSVKQGNSNGQDRLVKQMAC